MEERKRRDPLVRMEPRKRRIMVEGIRRKKEVKLDGRRQGMEARKRRIMVEGIRRKKEVKLEGRRQGMEAKRRTRVEGIRRTREVKLEMEMAKRTIMQTKRTSKKIRRIIMMEVERKEERTMETQGIGVIMGWESQHTTSFGVLIFHWSKFCKNAWKTR